MTISEGKGPRNSDVVAKWIVDQTPRGAPEPETPVTSLPATVLPGSISHYMAEIGRRGGLIGGKRRLKTMTKEQRHKIAKRAAKARWHKEKG